MKVNQKNSRDISFNGFWNNRLVKKGLEFAAENGTLFAATTTLALSTARPLVILATPNTDKKNKQIASAKSITSTINGYLIALLASMPLSRAIKRIDKNPEKYLKQETINNLKEKGEELTKSKAYSMATQLFKLGLGFIIAAPKAILTAIGTPYLLKLFNPEETLQEAENITKEGLTFKGKNDLSSGIGKILDKKKLQNFVKKYKDSNFPMHIIAATDTLSTAAFIHQTRKNKNLEQKDKAPLIYNSIISTGLSITSTYIIDHLTQGKTDRLIEKYKKINKNDPNLSKQIEGIKIAKPILIAGIVYYIAIPLISTFLADRIKHKEK